MAKIFPFKGLLPQQAYAKIVATLPYDVVNTQEASQQKDNPYHFYHVTRSEIDLPENIDVHSNAVYDRAAANLKKMIDDGILIQDSQKAMFIYELTMNGRIQTGLVCGSDIEEYNNGLLKKHEHTRPDKENDRINHIKTTQAQTGIIFLAYKDVAAITDILNDWKSQHTPLYDFIADDNIQHRIWKIDTEETIGALQQLFDTDVPYSYIADGHHRSAALSKLNKSAKHEQNNPYKHILTSFFPESELLIMDYNRIVKDLNNLSAEEFLAALTKNFDIISHGNIDEYKPANSKEFGMYINNQWYQLKVKPEILGQDTLSNLAVNILQQHILEPILGIDDPRINPRIDFVGGIRGLKALKQIVDNGEAVVAFACFPVTIKELFEVADANNVMPPKSTWFEPKTRDGLIVYQTFEQ